MSVLEFFRQWIGLSSGYDYLFVIASCAVGLIILDNILRAIFGIISSLFKK